MLSHKKLGIQFALSHHFQNTEFIKRVAVCCAVYFGYWEIYSRLIKYFLKTLKDINKPVIAFIEKEERPSCFHELGKVGWGQIIISINLEAAIKFSGQTFVMKARILMGSKNFEGLGS